MLCEEAKRIDDVGLFGFSPPCIPGSLHMHMYVHAFKVFVRIFNITILSCCHVKLWDYYGNLYKICILECISPGGGPMVSMWWGGGGSTRAANAISISR